jgi:hypothetical protein
MTVAVRNRGNEVVAEIERFGGAFRIRLLSPGRSGGVELCIVSGELGHASWAVGTLVAQWSGLDYWEVRNVVMELLEVRQR